MPKKSRIPETFQPEDVRVVEYVRQKNFTTAVVKYGQRTFYGIAKLAKSMDDDDPEKGKMIALNRAIFNIEQVMYPASSRTPGDYYTVEKVAPAAKRATKRVAARRYTRKPARKTAKK